MPRHAPPAGLCALTPSGNLPRTCFTELPDLPVGTRLRILPNHASATAAQHHGYHVVDSSKGTEPAPVIQARRPRITGR